MTSVAVVPVESSRVELGVLRAEGPAQLVANATAIADALRGVILSKRLYSTINGREYVRVEGWTTLATMMGCLPREVGMTRDDKGTYTATVELVRIADGAVLTRASAECGMDESTWAKRPDFARRSMAATRATSKTCRLAFSWVMTLAGYEATPREEMYDEDDDRPQQAKKQADRGTAALKAALIPTAPAPPVSPPAAPPAPAAPPRVTTHLPATPATKPAPKPKASAKAAPAAPMTKDKLPF